MLYDQKKTGKETVAFEGGRRGKTEVKALLCALRSPGEFYALHPAINIHPPPPHPPTGLTLTQIRFLPVLGG